MSCDFNFLFEQRDHVCKWEKTVHFVFNNNYVMTTPLKGLFSVMFKFPSLPVKNPNW